MFFANNAEGTDRVQKVWNKVFSESGTLTQGYVENNTNDGVCKISSDHNVTIADKIESPDTMIEITCPSLHIKNPLIAKNITLKTTERNIINEGGLYATNGNLKLVSAGHVINYDAMIASTSANITTGGSFVSIFFEKHTAEDTLGSLYQCRTFVKVADVLDFDTTDYCVVIGGFMKATEISSNFGVFTFPIARSLPSHEIQPYYCYFMLDYKYIVNHVKDGVFKFDLDCTVQITDDIEVPNVDCQITCDGFYNSGTLVAKSLNLTSKPSAFFNPGSLKAISSDGITLTTNYCFHSGYMTSKGDIHITSNEIFSCGRVDSEGQIVSKKHFSHWDPENVNSKKGFIEGPLI